MLIRGHNLVWATGAQTPAWVFRETDGVTPLSAANPADVSLLTQRIQNHLRAEVQHFGSAVYVWDVINDGGTVPESLIEEQGELYAKYFKVFRALRGKLDAVTFWGMADDNTWLDSFPISRLDLPLPFDTRLQAKPAYWGIVDPTKLREHPDP
jgi:GH35 family endo-1,4-beta-xylanase